MSKFPNWLRYGFPGVCTVLGTWQLYRLNWKQNLIADLERGIEKSSIKIETQSSLESSSLDKIKFRRLKLYGKPDLSVMPIFLGPRSARDIDMDFASEFIVPFTLSDGTRVLLNYGRVPQGSESKISIPDAPFVEGMFDKVESKPFYSSKNDPKVGDWQYKDLKEISAHFNTQPLLFRRISRRTTTNNLESPPIPFKPQISISNRHLEYVITWYGMAALTFGLSFLRRW